MGWAKGLFEIKLKIYTVWAKLLWPIIALGDILVDFTASFVCLFEGVDFSDLSEDFSWIEEDQIMELHSIRRDTFNAHNNYRTLHGCPPLIMSEELCCMAQAWADKLADKGILQYSENPNVGENISVVELDQGRKGEHVVKEWYKEIDNYNYSKPGWKRGAYHVSQLLWKSTSEIGTGIARAPGNKAFLVVNYRPAGNNNMPGEFERNVLPPQQNNNVNQLRRLIKR